MTQAIITAQDTKAAQDLARRRGELVPELVEAMQELIRYFAPMIRTERGCVVLYSAHAVMAKVEALK